MRPLKAPLREIFFCQCIDHGVALLISVVLLSIGFGNLSNLAQVKLLQMNGFFWLGLMLFIFSVSLLYRLLAVQFGGATLGTYLSHLSVPGNPSTFAYWRKQIFEASHWILPALWALEISLRYAGFSVGNAYALEFKASYHAKASELG